jgi:ElaB/YqjD/DUF883 family membrane-anchored ribosome-binding protein
MADTIGNPNDAHAQIAHLRAQVEALMKDRVTPAVTDMAGCAEDAMNKAAGMVREQTQSLTAHVREQPLISVLLAAGVGYLLGRTLH